jgi:N-acetylmuramoyl-L-alanine amidase
MYVQPIPAGYDFGPMTKRSETKRIMLHCTATPEGMPIDFDWLWRVHVKQNGWSGPGYHFLIELGGTVQATRPIDRVGAGCSGQNHDTIHISYAGGLEQDTKRSKDTRTPAQIDAMKDLLRYLVDLYDDIDDKRDIVGHNQFAAKDCPCFDVPAWVDRVMAEVEVPVDPEPDMPVQNNLYQRIRDLEARVATLERWRRS